jgi:hypothetical protein
MKCRQNSGVLWYASNFTVDTKGAKEVKIISTGYEKQ